MKVPFKIEKTIERMGDPMKKILITVATITVFFLMISSSIACDLFKELTKRGFSPDRLNTVLRSGFKADKAPGHRFIASNSFGVDLLIESTGRLTQNQKVEPLTGKGFYGTINGRRARLFVADAGFIGINFVSAPIVLAKNIPQQVQLFRRAQSPPVSFIPGKKIHSWDGKYLNVPAGQ